MMMHDTIELRNQHNIEISFNKYLVRKKHVFVYNFLLCFVALR